jgi:PAS domain S-box-containing protein
MMNFAVLLEAALEERGNAVLVIARPADGEDALILSANRPLAQLMGQSTAGLAGSPLRVLREVAASAADWTALVGALSRLTPLHLDMKLRADRPELWLGIGLTFVTDPSDGSSYGILVGRDITESRRRGLQESEMQRLLAAVFMRIAAPVAIVRANGTLLMANPAFQQLLHYEAEAIVGMNIGDLTAPESRQAHASRSQQTAEEGRYEMPTQYLTQKGERVPATVTSMPLRDWRGQNLRVLTVMPRPAARPPAAAIPAGDRRMASVGQVQAISLAAFKASFGAAWEQIAGKALTLAEEVLNQRLSAADVFRRRDDDGFLIWFDSPDERLNRTVLVAAAREVRLRFLTEFGDAAAGHVSAVVVGGEPYTPGVTPEASAALIERLRNARLRAAAETRAMLLAVREKPVADTRQVTDAEGRVRPISLVDFTPELCRHLGMHAAPPAPGAEPDVDVDLLRLQLAMAELGRRRGEGRVLVPIAWPALAGAERRRSIDALLAAAAAQTRSRLMLAVSGAPPLPSGKRWMEVTGVLRRELADIGLLVTLAEGDNAAGLESVVANWPLSLLVLDGSDPASLSPEGYFGVISTARRRDVAVLVRCSAASDMRDWRELGATLFAVPTQA